MSALLITLQWPFEVSKAPDLTPTQDVWQPSCYVWTSRVRGGSLSSHVRGASHVPDLQSDFLLSSAYWLDCLASHNNRRRERGISRTDICTSVFTATLCATAKRQTRHTPNDRWVKNLAHTRNRILYNLKKELNSDTYSMDEPWKYYTEWIKTVTKRQTAWFCSCEVPIVGNSEAEGVIKITRFREKKVRGELLFDGVKVSVWDH